MSQLHTAPSRPGSGHRPVLAWRGGAIIAALAALFAVPATAGATSPAATVTAANPQVQQVYHPGTTRTGSTSVPVCSKSGLPRGCYAGPLLSLRGTDVGWTAMEPTIGVAPDGTAYFGGASLVVDTSTVWGVARTNTMRSTDGGLHWTSVQRAVGPQTIPPANADPLIYVDAITGRVFNLDLLGACQWLNYSDDRGTTWTSNPLSCGNVPIDHQTMVTAKPVAPLVTTPLYPNLVVWCSNRIVDATCGRSLDGGITWSPAGQPFLGVPSDNPRLCSSLAGHLAADSAGNLFLPTGHCGIPEIAISKNSGTTWSVVTVSQMATPVTHTAVVADTAGNLFYTWIDRNQTPFLSYSRDHGSTWSAPMMIAPPGVVAANFPVVAAGLPGHVALSFPSTTQSTSKAAWNETVTETTDIFARNPIFVSAIGNALNNPIHRGACLGRCGGIWDFIDIHISKTGQAWVSTSDDCPKDCDAGAMTSAHAGEGLAIRQIGGPSMGSPIG